MYNPDFSDIYGKNEMRRLSDLIKNGVGCGVKAYINSGCQTLDGIITGTGKGSISKIEQFLKDINIYKEGALNPGVFIQSTHNTINGQIGIKLGANTYNMTHVNQGFTCTNVLNDAKLLLSELHDGNVLVGFFEENTDFNVDIHQSAGLSGKKNGSGYEITWGEGVSFFTLNNNPSNALCRFDDFKSFTNLSGDDHWKLLVDHIPPNLKCNKTICLLGANNQHEIETIYSEVVKKFDLIGLQYITFKEISGEFDTACSFAIDMAVKILTEEKIYEKVIICNHFKDYLTQYVEISIP